MITFKIVRIQKQMEKKSRNRNKEKNVPAPWARVADLVVAQSWVDIHGKQSPNYTKYGPTRG